MDLLRPLGLAGVPCAVVASPGAAVRFSRFARTALEWADPWDQPARLVDILVRFAGTQPEPPVLYYEADRDLLLVSRHRERLAQVFRFVVPDAALVEDLVDKARFQALARRVRLPVPPGCIVRPGEAPPPELAELRFPVVVKPLTRRSERWEPLGGSGKALRVESPQAMRELLPRLVGTELPLVVQELVPGPETEVESYHVYVDGRGETVGEFTGKKIRTVPAEYGHSTALEITDTADVTNLGRELVRRLDLKGVAKLDFKRAPSGELYLLEINARFNLWHHLGAMAGVNLPVLVYRDLVGLPRGAPTRARPGVRWCKPWQDWIAARAAGIPLRRWLPWALGCEAKRMISRDDPLPFLFGGLWEVGRRLAG
jgi:predicted ATP-grasp superfamily ATP-dependent carboligase